MPASPSVQALLEESGTRPLGGGSAGRGRPSPDRRTRSAWPEPRRQSVGSAWVSARVRRADRRQDSTVAADKSVSSPRKTGSGAPPIKDERSRASHQSTADRSRQGVQQRYQPLRQLSGVRDRAPVRSLPFANGRLRAQGSASGEASDPLRGRSKRPSTGFDTRPGSAMFQDTGRSAGGGPSADRRKPNSGVFDQTERDGRSGAGHHPSSKGVA